ncbi:MAG: S-adenosyl-l-methionine hydroxide adenosyltransferase family protein [Flavobacteriaceae bacterium]|tara:strand:- start:3920 stop:4750 length:831 start_codon:yes stop_codon:yes gene_type:complete
MSIITLTTDFGFKDYFISVIKASIYNEIPNANVIDISNSISPFNHSEAAYILKNAFRAFPKNSIHIVGVDSEFSPENKHLLMRFDNHYFIGADNGIFSLLLEGRKYDNLVEINIHNVSVSSFPVLDVFVKVAGHMSRKGNMEVVGIKTNELKEIINVNPVINESQTQLIGSVIYIDNFGNVVVNIKKNFFLEIQKSRDFVIYANSVKFQKIYNSYSEAIDFDIPKNKREEEGKKIAIWNSADYLEIAIYKSNPSKVGSANSLFGLEFRTTITVEFL